MPITELLKASLKHQLSRFVIEKSTDECWEWQGSKFREGYGRLWVNRKCFLAHRAAYVVVVGEIPKEKQIDHLCRNRSCISPWHLEAVTQRENLLRGEGLAAKNYRKTECKNGHPYNNQDTETYIAPSGKLNRRCKICTRNWFAKRKESNKTSS